MAVRDWPGNLINGWINGINAVPKLIFGNDTPLQFSQFKGSNSVRGDLDSINEGIFKNTSKSIQDMYVDKLVDNIVKANPTAEREQVKQSAQDYVNNNPIDHTAVRVAQVGGVLLAGASMFGAVIGAALLGGATLGFGAVPGAAIGSSLLAGAVGLGMYGVATAFLKDDQRSLVGKKLASDIINGIKAPIRVGMKLGWGVAKTTMLITASVAMIPLATVWGVGKGFQGVGSFVSGIGKALTFGVDVFPQNERVQQSMLQQGLAKPGLNIETSSIDSLSQQNPYQTNYPSQITRRTPTSPDLGQQYQHTSIGLGNNLEGIDKYYSQPTKQNEYGKIINVDNADGEGKFSREELLKMDNVEMKLKIGDEFEYTFTGPAPQATAVMEYMIQLQVNLNNPSLNQTKKEFCKQEIDLLLKYPNVDALKVALKERAQNDVTVKNINSRKYRAQVEISSKGSSNGPQMSRY